MSVFYFSRRMMVKYSSTFSLSKSNIKKNKTGKKEKLAAWERATGETMALFEALIFKTMIKDQNSKDQKFKDTSMVALFTGTVTAHWSAFSYCCKQLHPRCWHRSRIPLRYIWYPSISYPDILSHIFLQKIWFLLYISLQILL